MLARWIPLHFIIFILILFIPKYHAIRVVNYGFDNDQNTDQLVVRRFQSESCEGEESVSFKEFNLTEVPATAIKSSMIKNINLVDNLLNRVPTELFDNVPLLECLNVAYNKIPYQELFNFGHPKLKTLIVDHQSDIDQYNMLQSTKLEYSKAHFPNLKMLHINGISTFVLDMFPKNIFPQITTLYLTENEIQYIDSDFVSKLPTSLENLHFERNNINQFDVYSMGNVISFFLDDNPLQHFAIASNYTHLQILSLRNCSLTTDIIENHFYLVLNDLEILDLSVNRLDRVPDYLFDNAKYLQNLLLSNNSLTEVPHINKLRQLRKLSLNYNNIEIVTNLISNTLIVLNLQSNKISTITQTSFKHVPLLEELDLSYNKLEHLDHGWAHSLKNLKQLNLRFNRFAKIADMSLRPLVDLTNLYIKGNSFNEINENDIQLTPERCTIYVA